MRRYLLRRLLLAPVQVVALGFVTFLLLTLAPGDPAEHLARQRSGGQEPPAAVVQALRSELRLDEAIPVRFGRWLAATAVGDLGSSYRTGRPVAQDLSDRMGPTLLLTATALAVAVVAGVPLGVLTALRSGNPLVMAARACLVSLAAVPTYVLALAGILVLGAQWRWVPAFGSGTLRHLVLPALVLALGPAAQLLRLARASTLRLIAAPHVTVARAKGLPEATVVRRHVLPMALLPVFTATGSAAGQLLGGALVVETLFAWPGIGKYTVDAVGLRDIPAVQGATVYLTLAYLSCSMLVDLLHHLADPQLSKGGSR